MSVPTVYLDECVNHIVIAYLQRRGFRVKTAQSEGMFAEADDDQIRHAHANGWLLLSVNERDFYTWHYKPSQNPRSMCDNRKSCAVTPPRYEARKARCKPRIRGAAQGLFIRKSKVSTAQCRSSATCGSSGWRGAHWASMKPLMRAMVSNQGF
jgi:uncharacterized protein with PIN domain